MVYGCVSDGCKRLRTFCGKILGKLVLGKIVTIRIPMRYYNFLKMALQFNSWWWVSVCEQSSNCLSVIYGTFLKIENQRLKYKLQIP